MEKQQPKLLIVEDDLPVLNILDEKFRKEGFTVLKAKNGVEGLDLAIKKKPDMILLDIIMPVMDGFTMLRRLRTYPDGATIPVIVLTNLSDAEKASEAIQAGAYDFLVKANWTLEDVVKKVRERLKHH